MSRPVFSGIRRPVVAGIAFFSTVCVLSVGYAAWNASMPAATSGGTLTATGWNAVVGNVDDLNTRVTGLSSATGPWAVSGGNISYTGTRVGIGTANPGGILHIHQSGFGGIYFASDSTDNWIQSTNDAANAPRNMTISGHSAWIIPTLTLKAAKTYATGNIGIGIASPAEKLEVNGNAYVTGNTYGGLSIGEAPVNYSGWNRQLNIHGTGHSRVTVKTGVVQMGVYAHDTWQPVSGTMPGGFVGTYNDYPVSFVVNTTQRMVVATSGNVGIGTASPNTKLEVVGAIRNSGPSQGYLELSGDLPGYTANTYPTLRTNYTNLYFSAGGQFSAYMTQGGTWNIWSDKNKKENITQLDYQDILKKIDALPITQWNYKTEDAGTKHVGPFAQDFHALFGLNGPNDKMISTTDPSGIALAGIKGLSEKSKEVENRISEVEKRNQELAEENQELKSLVCLDHPEAAVCRQ